MEMLRRPYLFAALHRLLRNSRGTKLFRPGFLAGAEALVHFVLVTARLKPCPYYKA